MVVRVEQVVEGWNRLWCGVGAGWCTGWWLWGYWGWLGWSWGKVRVEQVVEIVVTGLVRAGGGGDEASGGSGGDGGIGGTGRTV